ncbi:uridylate kinase protein [Rutstroemia sp. NJR-2017a WRK4]|nr:uridylate kinase protein [Rutstroemia sp. NJR-2017a WRK4]
MDEQYSRVEVLPQNHSLLIYVIGCPGSGKGTLCKLLVQDYHCHHISVGDLLRDLRDEQNDQYLHIKDYIEEGKLVPTTTIIDILKHAITSKLETCHAIIIDGFPRRLDQGIASEDQAIDEEFDIFICFLIFYTDLVLYFDCDRKIALHRYLTRKLEGRLNDNEEIFHRRHEEFERLNPAILDYYRDLGVLIDINANEETRVSYQNLVTVLRSNRKWK